MSNAPLILVVEDEFSIAEVVLAYLEQAGFATKYLDSGSPVMPFLANNHPALIVLDLMLPDIDGITLCKTIRRHSDVPIIMATAKVDEIDRLLGLELGADDYICKPYSPRELVARVKTVLRRAAPNNPDLIISGPLQLNASTYQATLAGQAVILTPREFQLLQLFARNPQKVYSREQILQQLYQDEYVSDRAIDSHIKNLRKKLQQYSDGKEWIRSIYGVGYQFLG